MGPADITSIVLDEIKGTMEVAVTQDTLAQAIGKSGQNVRLSSQITGWKLNVIDEETALKNDEEKNENDSKIFVEKLDVDKDLAELLINQGYLNLESISSAQPEDLANIEGFDLEIGELLIERAKEALLTLTMEISTEEGSPDDLMSIEGMDVNLAIELSQKGINSREDLAEQSLEELLNLINLSEEDAGNLIMKARAHWFED